MFFFSELSVTGDHWSVGQRWCHPSSSQLPGLLLSKTVKTWQTCCGEECFPSKKTEEVQSVHFSSARFFPARKKNSSKTLRALQGPEAPCSLSLQVPFHLQSPHGPRRCLRWGVRCLSGGKRDSTWAAAFVKTGVRGIVIGI